MRRSRAAQKEFQDNARLLRAWRAWHREQLQDPLHGPHAAIVSTIVDFLRNKMAPHSAPQLLDLIRQHEWRLVDADVRLVLLHEINNASARLRERTGLSPFNDSLPGQRPALFETARALLDPHSCAKQELPGTNVTFPNREQES